MKDTTIIPKVHYHKLDRNHKGRRLTNLKLHKDNLTIALGHHYKEIGGAGLLVSLMDKDKRGEYFSVGVLSLPRDNGSVIRLNDELELVIRRKKST